MTKYNIEGGINFFEELYKSLDIEEDNNKTDADNNLCLITNLPLIEFFVTMKCGHKFNYIPLFLDIKNHKQKYNSLEGNSSRLSIDEIRCPYCRKKQSELLPYYEELNISKINGVNFYDPSLCVNNKNYNNYCKCEFLTPNINYDPSGNNKVETSPSNSGNCKYITCWHMGTKINYKYGIIQGENYGDNKYYCWNHKKQVIKKYKQDIKDKLKCEVKKAKEQAKNKAVEEKLKAKEDAKKLKKQIKNSIQSQMATENVVIGLLDVSGNAIHIGGNAIHIGCIQILKTGPNKGSHCGCKIVSENMCKRHYSKNNINNINN